MAEMLAALAGGLVVIGLMLLVIGLRKAPTHRDNAPRRRSRLAHRLVRVDRRTKLLAGAGVVAGVAVAALTGWMIAIIVIPAAVVGLPTLLSTPPSTATITKLEALEEWTRGLASILTVGVGLEEALRTSLRSTPDAIRPEVTTLVARLRARVDTETALRAFADDLNDGTGDLVAANLILGSRRRGQGLAAVLDSLAESVAADVRARREIEADRAKPRTTARWVTIITVGVLLVLAFTGDYIAPYGTPLGQVILTTLLAAYVALLLWMRSMARGEPLPRFLGQSHGFKIPDGSADVLHNQGART